MKTFNYLTKTEIFSNLFETKLENQKLLFLFYLEKYISITESNKYYLRLDERKNFLFPLLYEYLNENNLFFKEEVKNKTVHRLYFLEASRIETFLSNLKLIIFKIKLKSSIDQILFAILFLLDGYINDPQSKYYHLEFKFKSNFKIEIFNKIKYPLELFFTQQKINEKNTMFYIKKAHIISDLLKFLNAIDAFMIFEDIRIERDFISLYKKINAIDVYNLKKITSASYEINQKIDILTKNNQLKNLDLNYINLAKLRYENPHISLLELTQKYNEKYNKNLSKSTIFRWLKKILDFE